jgi:hypothetical protein
VSAGLLELPPISPSPAGPLTAQVPCRTSRVGGRVRYHDVTIGADWSVQTPHDIELERIAAAMGGYLSCVDLVDREVPALRELVQLRARRTLPDLACRAPAAWLLKFKPALCSCERIVFATAAEAAAHAREPLHVARRHGAVPRAVERLLAQVETAHGTAFYVPPADARARTLVRDYDGLALLWEAGVHPDLVCWLHDQLWRDGPALPVRFYLGAAVRRPDLRWIAETLAAVPDDDVAGWLAWTSTDLDHRHPSARAQWLLAGVPRRAIVALARGGYTPAEIAQVAVSTGLSAASAATALAAWTLADCHPTPDDVLLLDELGVDPWFAPSAAAVDWLWQRIRLLPERPSCTQAGLLLAVCGTRSTAMWALEHGAVDPRSAAQLMTPSDENEARR